MSYTIVKKPQTSASSFQKCLTSKQPRFFCVCVSFFFFFLLHLFKKIIFPPNETFVPSFILEHSFTAELKPPIIGEKWQTLNYSSMNGTAIIPGWTLSLDVCFWSVPGWHSASTFIFMIIQSKLWCNKLFKPVFLVKAMNQSAAGFFGSFQCIVII